MLLEEMSSQESWNDVMNRLRTQIPLLYPEWTDYNLHDPGITILEFFVWIQQIQNYHASQIGEAHRKKYARILGISAIPRRPGHTLVTVSGNKDRFLEAGTRFYADDICFESREGQMVVEGVFSRFITYSRNQETVLDGGWLAQGKGVSVCPFGKTPISGDSFIIELNRPLQVEIKHRLFMECFHQYPVKRNLIREEAYDGHGFYPLSSIGMEYLAESGWREVHILRDETYGMLQDGSVSFFLTEPMNREAYKLRFLLKRCDYLLAPCITRISLAMVEVWQQETRNIQLWFEGNGFPDQRLDLEDRELDLEPLEIQVEDPEFPGHMVTWKPVDDFDCSGPEDLHYVVDHGCVVFGDGFQGMMPEGRIGIFHMVRTLGDRGNIKAGAINRMMEESQQNREYGVDNKYGVDNEYDVTGGTKEETIEEVLERYQREKEKPRRAVTYRDYEVLIQDIPGLMIEDCKVYALHPENKKIIIAVKPYTLEGCGQLNEAYRKNLYRYLEEKRMIGTGLTVISPEYCELRVTCVVSAKVQYRNAGAMVETVIAKWVRNKRFGEGILYGDVFGLIDSLPYVQQVSSVWLDAGRMGRRNQLGDVALPPEGLFSLKSVTCHLMGAGER